VPAFSITAPTAEGTTLEPPAPVQPRAGDLVVRWQVGGPTDLFVSLSGDDARGPERPGGVRALQAYCRFPASLGTGTIPSSVLERFAPGRAVLRADALTESQHTIGRFAATAVILVPMKNRRAELELR
jgi:hypothetical protein